MSRPYVPGHGPTGSPDNPKYPDVEVQLTGNDGNAFGIIGRVSVALRRASRVSGVPAEAADQFTSEAFECQSYDDLLNLVACWVTVN